MSKKLDSLVEQIKDIDSELETIGENDLIKRYNMLLMRRKYLNGVKKEEYEYERKRQFLDCNHIFVDDGFGSKFCIKCGLDTIYNHLEYVNYDNLSFDEQIMFDYMLNSSNEYKDGRTYNNEYNLDKELIRSIYLRLKEEYPNLDEEAIFRYLDASLHNIATKDKDEEENIKRIRRLDERNKNYGFKRYI